MGHIKVGGKVQGFEIGGLVQADGSTTDLGECEVRGGDCTFVAELREDPYENDVNDNPGVMMWACPECYQDRKDAI